MVELRKEAAVLMQWVRVYFSFKAATPGRTLPSSSSKEAPPPVDTWEMESVMPACSAAATESPPPTMVMQPLGVRPAKVWATPCVCVSAYWLGG